jgi:hypothetical protein
VRSVDTAVSYDRHASQAIAAQLPKVLAMRVQAAEVANKFFFPTGDRSLERESEWPLPRFKLKWRALAVASGEVRNARQCCDRTWRGPPQHIIVRCTIRKQDAPHLCYTAPQGRSCMCQSSSYCSRTAIGTRVSRK